MNCRPGDLAVIVSAQHPPANAGRFVTVLRPVTHGEIFPTRCGKGVRYTGPTFGVWVVEADRPLEWQDDEGDILWVKCRPFSDRRLRPIRDPGDDAADEMLRPLPDEVCA